MCCLVKFFVGLVSRCNFVVTVVESFVVWFLRSVKNLVCRSYVLVFRTHVRMVKWNVMCRL